MRDVRQDRKGGALQRYRLDTSASLFFLSLSLSLKRQGSLSTKRSSLETDFFRRARREPRAAPRRRARPPVARRAGHAARHARRPVDLRPSRRSSHAPRVVRRASAQRPRARRPLGRAQPALEPRLARRVELLPRRVGRARGPRGKEPGYYELCFSAHYDRACEEARAVLRERKQREGEASLGKEPYLPRARRLSGRAPLQ